MEFSEMNLLRFSKYFSKFSFVRCVKKHKPVSLGCCGNLKTHTAKLSLFMSELTQIIHWKSISQTISWLVRISIEKTVILKFLCIFWADASPIIKNAVLICCLIIRLCCLNFIAQDEAYISKLAYEHPNSGFVNLGTKKE